MSDPCAVGATALHKNSGQRWTVIEPGVVRGFNQLGPKCDNVHVRRDDGTERWVTRSYWTGEGWRR